MCVFFVKNIPKNWRFVPSNTLNVNVPSNTLNVNVPSNTLNVNVPSNTLSVNVGWNFHKISLINLDFIWGSIGFHLFLSNSRTFLELRATSTTESTGVACSDSVSHKRVQVLSIPVCYVVKITITMKTNVQKSLMIKIIKLCLRKLVNRLFVYTHLNDETSFTFSNSIQHKSFVYT